MKLIALTRELPGDLDTPVSAYIKLATGPYTYLFESVQGGERFGRYSFIGLPAREVLRVRGQQVSRERDGVAVESSTVANPLHWLAQQQARLSVAPDPTLPRFTGGLVGYFGYDAVQYIEPQLKLPAADPLGLPELLFMVSEELVVFDNLRATLTLVVHAEANNPADHARAEARLDAIAAQLAIPLPPAAKLPKGTPPDLTFSSTFQHADYLAAVARAKDYILAGDTFQVQIGQRLSAPYTAGAVALYRAIRRLNPSPYLFCLNLGDHQVVGSSPEILVRLEQGMATVRPIAGTRPRGNTPEHDVALEQELLADPKERAEHLMLIDLGRNDVGRICTPGVKVTEQFTIERYSHVMHIVSNVTGPVKPGLSALDVLAATFPAGTLTGAPKVRTMEIISELEPVRRGLYGGAVGYLGWDGNMDMAIAIRTAVLKDGQVHVQASAGIVADSVAQLEWEETLHKAKAMMKAAALASA